MREFQWRGNPATPDIPNLLLQTRLIGDNSRLSAVDFSPGMRKGGPAYLLLYKTLRGDSLKVTTGKLTVLLFPMNVNIQNKANRIN